MYIFRNDFRDYAELCFKEFGDRVKHWITLNEPWSYSHGAYAVGGLAPGRCSGWQHLNCTGGDSGTEPYLVSHNQLLARASAVKVYKQNYQVLVPHTKFFHVYFICTTFFFLLENFTPFNKLTWLHCSWYKTIWGTSFENYLQRKLT